MTFPVSFRSLPRWRTRTATRWPDRAKGVSSGAPVGAPRGRGFVRFLIHPRLFGEFFDPTIDRLVEGVDLMPPHKLHEPAASVRGAVDMEDVPREFLSVRSMITAQTFLSLSSLKPPLLSCLDPTTKAARGSCEHEPTWGSLQADVTLAAFIVRCNMAFA